MRLCQKEKKIRHDDKLEKKKQKKKKGRDRQKNEEKRKKQKERQIERKKQGKKQGDQEITTTKNQRSKGRLECDYFSAKLGNEWESRGMRYALEQTRTQLCI